MSSRGKVMVVDDDPLVLKIVRSRLERAGFTVTTRSEALGTSQAISQEQPDVVLLDLKMPALTGDLLIEAARKAGKASANVAFIFHSGEALAVLQEKAQRAGAIGAIAKTDDEASFLAQFERLFERAMRKRGP